MPKAQTPRKKARKPNAPRDKWPDYLHNGRLSDDYKAFSDDVSLCYDLVAIGSHVLDRPLELIIGGKKQGITRAYTEGPRIYIPKMHPRRVLVTKHELAHHYFGSDAYLRLLFVKEMLSEIERGAGADIPAAPRARLIEQLCFVINIFDDVRVNSLWGLLYPGDGEEMDDWYYGHIGPRMKQRALQRTGGDVQHLFTYIILIALQQQVESSVWGDLEEDVLQAVSDVHYKSFGAALLLVKKLMLQITQRLADSVASDPKHRPAWGGASSFSPSSGVDGRVADRLQKRDMVRALTELGGPPPNDIDDDNAGFDHKQGEPQPSPTQAKFAKAALRTLTRIDVEDDGELGDVLQKAEQAGVQKAQRLRRATSRVQNKKETSPEDYANRKAKATINHIRVRKDQVVPTVLSAEEEAVAEQWSALFRRLVARRAYRTEEQGEIFDVDLYIQQRLQGLPLECFRTEAKGRGFCLTILVDLSGSMSAVLRAIERLIAVIHKALDFPFVSIRVVGFNSTESGAVNIYEFPRGCKGLISPNTKAEGLTPLPSAIRVTGRLMASDRDDNYLLILSDGEPTYMLEGGRVIHQGALYEWTRDAVVHLRQQRVDTWCFMIGDWVPSAKDMDFMFGAPRWRSIDTEDVYDDAFAFITELFQRFIQTR